MSLRNHGSSTASVAANLASPSAWLPTFHNLKIGRSPGSSGKNYDTMDDVPIEQLIKFIQDGLQLASS
jgi:hypothetical protein